MKHLNRSIWFTQVHHDKVIEVRHAREQEQVKCEKDKITLKKKYLKEKNDAVSYVVYFCRLN